MLIQIGFYLEFGIGVKKQVGIIYSIGTFAFIKNEIKIDIELEKAKIDPTKIEINVRYFRSKRKQERLELLFLDKGNTGLFRSSN